MPLMTGGRNGQNGSSQGAGPLCIRVVAPAGRDAALIATRLADAGLQVEVSPDVAALCARFEDEGAGALVVASEALDTAAAADLGWLLQDQPVWADVPLLLLAAQGQPAAEALRQLGRLADRRSVTAMERPVQTATLVSAVQFALAARQRQYDVRDLLGTLELSNQTLEHRVEMRTRALAQRTRELQNFAYVASHDLREPLRKITTFGSLLEEEAGDRLGEEGRFFVTRMRSAARRMSGLLDDLLTFSRIATDTRPFAFVRLGDVVRDVLGEYGPQLRAASAEVDADAAVSLEADRRQLRQLITHLVDNALKFRRDGAPLRLRIRARVASEEAGDQGRPRCRITVEDNGIGIDEEHAERVFEPFERLHGTGQYEGNGMGLAISRRIVERHGGCIEVQPLQDGGTRIVVILPVRQPGPAAGAQVAGVGQPASEA